MDSTGQTRKPQSERPTTEEDQPPEPSPPTTSETPNVSINPPPPTESSTTPYPTQTQPDPTTQFSPTNATKPTHVQPQSPTANPRHTRLQTSISALQSRIATTRSDLTTALSQLQAVLPPAISTTDVDDQTLKQARSIVRKHIRLLQQYNEIKDIGMGLMGLIAESEGRRVSDVMDELGIEDD